MWVIDTNVVVSGLITKNADSPAAQWLDGMVLGRFPFALSAALLAEYRRVLLRPALRKLHGLNEREVDAVLLEVAQHAVELQAVPGPSAPDPGDQMLWDLLASHESLLLVTGDKRLQVARGMQGRVLSPAEALSR